MNLNRALAVALILACPAATSMGQEAKLPDPSPITPGANPLEALARLVLGAPDGQAAEFARAPGHLAKLLAAARPQWRAGRPRAGLPGPRHLAAPTDGARDGRGHL